MKQLDKIDIDNLVDEVLNDAIYKIQHELGVHDGFMASIFFSGGKWGEMTNILTDYINYELKHKE